MASEASIVAGSLEQFKKILPSDAVLSGADTARYRQNCLGLDREIPLVLRPSTEEQIVEIVRIANARKIALYAVSTGHNWGYGTALPIQDQCVLVDLSRMNRILDMDEELGLITLEPGVTQKQLFDYLESKKLNFFVPTTGAGPTASIVGNALERGFGMTPEESHFSAVTSLRAVLPTGEIYQPYMSEIGAGVSGVWRWGIGPFLNGLFSQGNVGIVTSLQISLVRRPAHIEVYLFTMKDDSGLPKLLKAQRDLLVDMRGHLGGVKFINQRQIELTIGVRDIGMNLASEFAWMGFGVIRCKPSMTASIRKEIRSALKPHVSRLVFVNAKRVKFLGGVYSFVPGKKGATLKDQAGRIEHLLDIVNGIPRGLELKLVYRDVPMPEPPLDPARDGVGVIWYAPVLPLKIGLMMQMIEMVKETLGKHGFDQALSFTTIDEKCAIGVVPLIFRRPGDKDKAHACFQELWRRGAALGCHPYRINIAAMPEMTDPDKSVFWSLAARIKAAVDPNRILSPGRYDGG